MEKTPVILLLFFFISTGMCSWTRNASFLQHELLKKMDVHVRPKEQTVINVTFVLTSLNKLDTVLQELWTTFILHMTWTDQRLAWEPQDGEPEDLVFYVKDIWTPPLVVSNAVQDAIFLLRDDTVPMRVTNNGTVTWVPRVSPVTTCDIDISKFPLDFQICHINITSWVHSVSELDLIQAETYRYKKAVNLDLYNDQAWDLFEATVQSQNVSRSSDFNFKNMQYTLYFRRHERFYWILLIIPFCCLSFLMALVFLVPSKFQEFKVTYSVTLLVSFQLYLNLLQTLLPPVFNEGKSHILGEYVAAAMSYGTAITGLLIVQLVIVYFVRKMHRMCLISGSVTGTIDDSRISPADKIKPAILYGSANGEWGLNKITLENGSAEREWRLNKITLKMKIHNYPGQVLNNKVEVLKGEVEVLKGKVIVPKQVVECTLELINDILPSDAILSGLTFKMLDNANQEQLTLNGNILLTCPGSMSGHFKCTITGVIVNGEIRDATVTGRMDFGFRSLAKLPKIDFIMNFLCFTIFFIVYIASIIHFMAQLRE